ncbi:MAG: biopolymer transporter ExbD [Candidatus Kapabacteria bacterium]|nr:biopolymer transporter ExbD [Candidatus Kapabacteria bacterium]
MSGGGALSGGGKTKRGKVGKRKKIKRVGFHLDMTPLVDITFLLLTFFMFTTTMATPQIMEMTVPPDIDTPVDVKESELMTLLLDDDGKIYWFMAKEKAVATTFNEIKAIALRENLAQKNRLITVLKVGESTAYGNAIKILDQLNLAEVGITEQISKDIDKDGKPTKRQRKFTLLLLDEKDKDKIKESAL